MIRYVLLLLVILLCTGCTTKGEITYVPVEPPARQITKQEHASEPSMLLNVTHNNIGLVNIVTDLKIDVGFIIPLDKYRKTSSYGERWGRLHKGIDLAVPEGTPIKASCSGFISTVKKGDTGYGYHIVIDHSSVLSENYCTRYAHMSSFADVKVGDYVKQGQIIGYSGNTGNSTGPHLHFEIIKDNTYINPESLLDF